MHERLHDFSRQQGILVIARLEQKIPYGLGVAGPVRRKYGIRWKAFEGLIVAKHIAEEFFGFLNLLAFFRLVVDNPNPCTDA
jgi:hypothetical protein